MSEDGKIDAIEKVGSSAEKFSKVSRVDQPNTEKFEALMQEDKTSTQAANQAQQTTVEEARKPSLEEEVRKLQQQVNTVASHSPEQLAAQTEGLLAKIGDIKEKLQQPNVQIKKDYQNQLKNKLEHIDDKLKVALTHAGIEYQEGAQPVNSTSPTNVIDRFLGFLTHGESQLETLATDVREWGDNKDSISPASMLLVQIKVSQIQQELELFTGLLSKALDATKTMMNVQV